ncbi:C1-like domain protein, putative (macronuclear) [Tetrahymena thermophila SB210]|uniref:C1-like domain protein, putative n=1 Tax=Tetrahymena thermophila (strain SB210) TaxID=312017 RepID=W7X4L9_TETTS|nr:C1-like domain protein, putative [Tetrahymena thermophila SB210]EWS71318.1 C1-like domain protein, putative [Tetrahymena thermophila SB210]|eukprot:XP_012656136.1 C1-like domain protein, putative [Tetrahymena thermophila SB210]
MNFQINLSCSNHPQKKVEFFAYNQTSNKYELVCSRCISKLPKDFVTIDNEEVFSESQKYITNWPPLKNEQLQQQIQKKLENQDNQETKTDNPGKCDNQQLFTKMSEQFSTFLVDFEENLKKQPQGSQLIQQKYQEISQSKQLLSFIKQEVSKKEKFSGVSQDFKSFLQQRCQDNSTDKQLEQALIKQDKNAQEEQIVKLQQALKIFYNNYNNLPQKFSKIQRALDSQKKQQTKLEEENEMLSLFNEKKKPEDEQWFCNMNHFYQKCLGKKQRFTKEHFKHLLEFTLGKSQYCTKCSRVTKSYYWACQQCKYYLCLDCSQKKDQFNIFYDKLLNSRLQKNIREDKNEFGYFFVFAFKSDGNRFAYCDKCSRQLVDKKKYAWYSKSQQFLQCLVCFQGAADIFIDKNYYAKPDIPSTFFNPGYMQILQQNQQYVIEFFVNPANKSLKKDNQLPYIHFQVETQQNSKQQDSNKQNQNQPHKEYQIVKQSEFQGSLQKQIIPIQDNAINQSTNNINWSNSNSDNNNSNNLNNLNVNQKLDIPNSQINQVKQIKSTKQYDQQDQIIIINFSEFFKKNLNVQKKFPKIDFKHDLKFTENTGKNCKLCNRCINQYCWSCDLCQYYVCIECLSIETFTQFYQKLINSECDEKIGLHNHSKMQFKKFTNMYCGQCRKDSKTLLGWECSDPVNKCNFCVCLDCSSKFGEIMVDSIIYSSTPDIPVQTSQNQFQNQQDDENFMVVNFQEFFKKNLNIQKKFPKIDFKHDLTFAENAGKYCKLCNRSINQFCWSCDSCNYNVCLECISIETFTQYYQKLINSECDEKIGSHQHSKMQFKQFTKMECSSCRKDSKTLLGWDCSDPVNKCRYTVCIDCSSKFGEIMVDTKVYNSIHDSPVQSSQNKNINENQFQNQQDDEDFMIVNFQDFFKKNLNIQKKFPKIDFKHDLKFAENAGKYCKLCSRSIIQYCWSCDSCKYYVCIECISIETFTQYYQKLINSECDEKIGSHQHSKMQFKKFTKMECDSCRKDSKTLLGWKCSDPVNKCRYTVCIDCSSKFGEVMVDTKVYNSIPDTPIQSSQNMNINKGNNQSEYLYQNQQDDENFMIVNFQEFFKKNLSIHKKFPKIDFKHDLTFAENAGKYCKLCSRSIIQYCWSCDSCKYYVCIECISIETFTQYYQKLINSECDEKIGSHQHSKMQFKKFTKMECDSCRKDSKTLLGWQCSDPVNKCRYTVCIDCSSKFGEVMVDTKVYNSIHDTPVQSSQNMNIKEHQFQNQQDDEGFMIVNFQEFFKKNLNIQKKFPKIDFKHDLTFAENAGKYCKLCSRSIIQYCWSCDSCKYYVCIECISIETFTQYYYKLINSECDEKIGSHQHSKMQFKQFTKMECDSCRKDSKTLLGWQCSDPVNKCRYTVCIDCSSKFGEVMVDTKVYNSMPDTPVQSSQNKNINENQFQNQQDDENFMIVNFQDFFRKNLNIQKKFPKIDFKHDLTFSENAGKYCKLCNRSINQFCWSCDSCNYYVCIECVSIEPFNLYYQKLINSECDEKIKSHQHSKMQFKKFTKMECDSCRKDSKTLLGWECSDPVNKCRYTVCIDCSSKFGEVMVDTKVYNSMPDTPVQSSQNMNINEHQFQNQQDDEDFMIVNFQEFFKKNLNIHKKFPKIHFKHNLTFVENAGKYCKLCNRSIKHYCWSCDSCKYYVCIECISIESFNLYYQKLINSECDEKIGSHRHSKMQFKKFTKMDCDSCRKDSKTLLGWECSDPVNKCGYTVCIDCSSNFGDLMVDINIYKSISDFIPQIEDNEEDELVLDFQFLFKSLVNIKHRFYSLHYTHDLCLIQGQGKNCNLCWKSTLNVCWNCQECQLFVCLDCIPSTKLFRGLYDKLLNSEAEEDLRNFRHKNFIFTKNIKKESCTNCQDKRKAEYGWICREQGCGQFVCLNCSSNFQEINVNNSIGKQESNLITNIFKILKNKQNLTDSTIQEINQFNRDEEDEKIVLYSFDSIFKNNINLKNKSKYHNDHELELVISNEGYCKRCVTNTKGLYVWNCEQCKIKYCINCTTFESDLRYYYDKFINSEYDQVIKKHRHMKFVFRNNQKGKSIQCDLCNSRPSDQFYYWSCAICDDRFEICLRCSLTFGEVKIDQKIYQSSPDPPQRLAVQQKQQEEQKEEENIKLNINQYFQNCINSKQQFDSHNAHELVFSDIQKGTCRQCDRSLKSYSWRCEQCNYSLCLDCSSTVQSFKYFYNKIVKAQYEQQAHNHKHTSFSFVSFADGKSGKRCDICSRSLYYYGWKCGQCSFDLCLNCSGKFETVKLDLEVYKSQPSISQNQIKESEVTVINFKQFFQNCLNVRQIFDSHKDHELTFTNYQKGCCRKCDRQLKTYSWRCEPCNYSLCLDCTSTLKYFQFFYNKLVKSSYQQKIDKHNHQQIDFIQYPDGKSKRICDVCSKSIFYYGWKCPQCAYDVCLNCSGQYENLNINMEVYNSQPNVPQVFTSQ